MLSFYFYVRPWKVGPEVFFIYGNAEIEQQKTCIVEITKTHIKADNAEENCKTTSFGEKYFFNCGLIYFPKSKCDCK